MLHISRHRPASPLRPAPGHAKLWAVLLVGFALCAGGARADTVVEVQLDQARIVTLPENVKTLILGNPVVADVTLLNNGKTMVITGKGFGETNLIALDADGKPVAESIIRVNAASGKLVVQRGMERETYICNPHCQPTLSLGDATKFSGEIAGEMGTRNGLSMSGTVAPVAAAAPR